MTLERTSCADRKIVNLRQTPSLQRLMRNFVTGSIWNLEQSCFTHSRSSQVSENFYIFILYFYWNNRESLLVNCDNHIRQSHCQVSYPSSVWSNPHVFGTVKWSLRIVRGHVVYFGILQVYLLKPVLLENYRATWWSPCPLTTGLLLVIIVMIMKITWLNLSLDLSVCGPL